MSDIKLFSFRRCPYAIRARYALLAAKINYRCIEVSLKNKPQSLFDHSPKGTVPVLVTKTFVLEQSLDIIYWVLQKNDPGRWLRDSPETQLEIKQLIETNDNDFKQALDRYKYPNRYLTEGDKSAIEQQAFQKCIKLLKNLDLRLNQSTHLIDNKTSIADIALFPFVRQFHHVNKEVLPDHGLSRVIKWLEFYLNSEMFTEVMKKN